MGDGVKVKRDAGLTPLGSGSKLPAPAPGHVSRHTSFMSELDQALSRLRAHQGVRDILLLGRDGLLVRHLGGETPIEVETVAAMVPALATSCAAVGRATEQGEFTTAVVEFAAGVFIVVSLSADLLLALVLDQSVGFAPLLREVRRERDRLASLL